MRSGRHIHVSGTTATHGSRVLGGADPAAQTHAVIDKIAGALQSLGGRLEHVVRTRVYVSNLAHWEAVARAHGERFATIQPANTLVEARLVGRRVPRGDRSGGRSRRRIGGCTSDGHPSSAWNVSSPDNGVEIWVKWEGANPTGSMKDRMALSMVQGAERRGQLRPGGRVVDYTGGSTGSSLAMVCAALGYQAHFVSSDAFAEEKLQTMRAFGARLDVVPSEGGKITPALIQAIIAQAEALSDRTEHVLDRPVQQPRQPAPAITPMAEETIAALGGRVDEFVMMVGTSGCFSGNADVFKAKVPGVRCVAGEPATSRALTTTGPFTGHRIEGTGAGFVPGELPGRPGRRRRRRVRRRRLRHGASPGPRGRASSAASRRAPTSGSRLQRARALPAGARIVTTICDSGLKYLQGDLYRS